MHTTTEKTKGYSLTSILIIVFGLVMIATGSYFYLTDKPTGPVTTESVSVIEPKIEETAPVEPVAQQEPIAEVEESAAQPAVTAPTEEEAEPAVKFPLLNESDALALASAQQLSTLPEYTSLLSKQEMIRNFVVFIDNFSRGELVLKFSPLTKPDEPFSIVKVEQKMYLNTESYNRYNIYAEIINSIDIESAVSQYRTLKPLFDEAYQELGYPEAEFTDRLNDAIELILATPVISEPIALVAPSAMYKFADPELEALPDAQKLLMRMGPDNILILKAKLQLFQQALQVF